MQHANAVDRQMRLQALEMEGIGRRVRVRLFVGDGETMDQSSEWLESTVEVSVRGMMDSARVQQAALARLRDVLEAEIRALGDESQQRSA